MATLHASSRGVLLLALLGDLLDRRRHGVRTAAVAGGGGLDALDLLAGTLEDLEVGGGEVTLATIAGAAVPPLAGSTGGVILAKNGDKIALANLKLDTRVGLRHEVVEEAAELELGGVDGLLLLEGLLLQAAFLLLVGGSESLDHLGHQVGKTERGEEEEEERLAAGTGRAGRGAVGADFAAFEAGEGGGRQSRGIGRRRTAGDFGDEGAYPPHEGKDTENRAERIAKIAELLSNRDHGWKTLVSHAYMDDIGASLP